MKGCTICFVIAKIAVGPGTAMKFAPLVAALLEKAVRVLMMTKKHPAMPALDNWANFRL